MAYVIKYIGNRARKEIDIQSLYQSDIDRGQRVILVCEKERSMQYCRDNIKLIDSPVDATGCDDSLMLLQTDIEGAVRAVECAFALYTGECQVYIKNEGLYTADPRHSENTVRIEKIDYDEVAEICTAGYNVVSNAMVEKAKKYGIALNLLSYNNPSGKGTVIKEVMSLGTSMVKGIIKEPDMCIISLTGIPDVVGISYRIFRAVSDGGIVVDMISLPASDYGRQDISFTIKKEFKLRCEKILKAKRQELGYEKLTVKDNVAKISVVGSGVQSGKGVAAQVFKILYENNINVRLISTSEIKISVIVDKKDSDVAVQQIHDYFIK